MNVCKLLLWSMILFGYSSSTFAITFYRKARLLKASYQGDFSTVQKMLEKGADPNAIYEDNHTTPLIFASYHGYNGIVKELLKYPLNYHFCDIKKRNALMYAIIKKNYIIANMLLDKANDTVLTQRDFQLNTVLHFALFNQDQPLSFKILERNVDLYAHNIYSATPLSMAVKRNQKKIIEKIISKGYNINYQTPVTYTYQDYKESINGSKRLLRKTSALTILMVAAKEKDVTPQTFQDLLVHKPNLDIQDMSGNTALIHAAQACTLSKVKLLARKGCSLDIENFSGDTALTVAIKNACTDVQIYLKKMSEKKNKDKKLSPKNEDQKSDETKSTPSEDKKSLSSPRHHRDNSKGSHSTQSENFSVHQSACYDF